MPFDLMIRLVHPLTGEVVAESPDAAAIQAAKRLLGDRYVVGFTVLRPQRFS